MRVAIVQEDGLPYAGGEIELARERLELHVGWRQVAEEVEPDLPDRRDAALSSQRLEPLPVRFGRGGGEVRMDPRPGGDQARTGERQLECRFGGGQVVAGDQDPLDAGRQRAVDDLVAVGVEGLVLQVAMGVDQACAQGAASCSTSTRGKMGRACRVRHSVGPPPQASSEARPGPPAPRSS